MGALSSGPGGGVRLRWNIVGRNGLDEEQPKASVKVANPMPVNSFFRMFRPSPLNAVRLCLTLPAKLEPDNSEL